MLDANNSNTVAQTRTVGGGIYTVIFVLNQNSRTLANHSRMGIWISVVMWQAEKEIDLHGNEKSNLISPLA